MAGAEEILIEGMAGGAPLGLDGRGLDSDIDMIKSVAHQITGINLCPLGDSIEPFLGSVITRFEDQFRAYVKKVAVPA